LFYVYEHGIATGLIRGVLAVPGHACDGIFMGYFLGLAKLSSINNRIDLKNKYMLLSIVVPVTLHGIYDYCLFTGNPIFVGIFFIFIILLYIFAIKRVNKISSVQNKFRYVDTYCPICGRKIDSNYCPICGRRND
jgi:RsiW-degrading membrane proteinase PrsW (M82 family)